MTTEPSPYWKCGLGNSGVQSIEAKYELQIDRSVVAEDMSEWIFLTQHAGLRYHTKPFNNITFRVEHPDLLFTTVQLSIGCIDSYDTCQTTEDDTLVSQH